MRESWLINGHLGLRAGYTALTSSENLRGGELTRGVSFRNSAGQLDYAYVSGRELEQGIHWISATLRWGRGAVEPPPTETPLVAAKTEAPEKTAPILMPATLTPKVVNPETVTVALQLSGPRNFTRQRRRC